MSTTPKIAVHAGSFGIDACVLVSQYEFMGTPSILHVLQLRSNEHIPYGVDFGRFMDEVHKTHFELHGVPNKMSKIVNDISNGLFYFVGSRPEKMFYQEFFSSSTDILIEPDKERPLNYLEGSYRDADHFLRSKLLGFNAGFVYLKNLKQWTYSNDVLHSDLEKYPDSFKLFRVAHSDHIREIELALNRKIGVV